MTAARKPFTKRDRQRISQYHLGRRPTNHWGDGDLPAPWAEGDVVEIVDGTLIDPEVASRIPRYGDLSEGQPHEKLNLAGFYCVSTVFSIDDGDAWYCRVDSDDGYSSDRLHVAFASRSNWDHDCDYMAPFQLVETADVDGLRRRQEMLAAGWPTPEQFSREVRCPTCRTVLPTWHELHPVIDAAPSLPLLPLPEETP